MTRLLQQAIAEIEKFPEDIQNAIAARLLANLADEKEWAARLGMRFVVRLVRRRYEGLARPEKGRSFDEERHLAYNGDLRQDDSIGLAGAEVAGGSFTG